MILIGLFWRQLWQIKLWLEMIWLAWKCWKYSLVHSRR